MGYKILAKFCQEKDVTDAHKEGILLGMHIMALQTEKWLDNDDHATAYRMDTWDECGFSGWREIYEHTKGFLEAEQPEDSDVSDMEVTDDEEEKSGGPRLWATPQEIANICDMIRRTQFGVVPTCTKDDEFEVVDNEDKGSDEEDSDEESDWTQYTFENVEYLVGPEADLGRVVLETEDYQPVGVFEDDKIVFEDNGQFENHLERVRHSTIPEDPEEAFDLITSFLEDHYEDLAFNDYQESTCAYSWSLHVYKDSEELSHEVSNQWFYFGVEPSYSSSAPKRTNILGKNMGEVMKEIEALL